MEYKNPHGVRFKVYNSRKDHYVVKYYPCAVQWPRRLRSFYCPTDAARHEMFFLIGNMRHCVTCRVSLLGHLDDPAAAACQDCILKEAAAAGLAGGDIPECPVCYQKMLSVDGTRKTLACRHQVCLSCVSRLAKSVYAQGWSITCPMCRDTSMYDAAFRPTMANVPV
jgi:hypothetical protein